MASQRSILAARVLALREHGYTYREIAVELGISRSYANEVATDQDRSRVRARKQSYGSPCIDCGQPTDGSNGIAKAPDRCDACHRLSIAAQHGTRSKYTGGCHCGACRAASAQYQKTIRLAGLEPPTHGLSGYTNYGCRCDICRGAKSIENRRYREQRKAATS